ncbi:hypothetical protein AG1IA_01683 [Rhizoctonia solani AG-1 IA]|uniref:Uncharacterized protein n=1 Tax=Thanatephorus cucumeris (strain AG1-IA) TaxID=983506 RepID=L8X1W7_THACA|nr:hypothetical protein AG1IA_01683 [Rhizoctonia solani AG-1 IA]
MRKKRRRNTLSKTSGRIGKDNNTLLTKVFSIPFRQTCTAEMVPAHAPHLNIGLSASTSLHGHDSCYMSVTRIERLRLTADVIPERVVLNPCLVRLDMADGLHVNAMCRVTEN